MAMWTIQAEPVDGAGVEDAMRQYLTEMGWRVLGRAVTEEELRGVLAEDPHHDLAPPDGVFLVARSGGGAFLGCAGVRLLAGEPATAELKRMFVRPAGRGAGLGRGLLLAAEASAAALGAERVVCETNTQLTEARALYMGHGYEETAPYVGHGKADHWYAKALG
ncbi:GNAT family N-acetyltransferase [Streptomyces phytophilus]|uniref:GNAT family N-acetyltransferase n=1 Tax=Streptomyces phytophilus TaxID=722715 RepID=UPI0015F012F3|nr:GNAT family N-acetyltransferase [Streptomyces phytophilus]